MSHGQRDEIIQRARDIVPRLREAARQAELDRTISDAVQRDFLAAGFYRVLQPRRFGGLELDLGSMVDIAAEIGRGCGSSAWIFTNLAVQAWINGMKDPRAQEEIWGDEPDTLACSAYPGQDARITAVDGGFEVHGTWNYSSGIDFADWINLQIFLRDEGSPPRHLFAAIPKSSCSVVDDWFVTGLAGTGSRSIVIEESFIPDYRTIDNTQLQMGAKPGSAVNPGVLYKLPFWGIGGKVFSSPAIGIARGALELVERDLESRVATGGIRLAEQPTVQLRIAESGAEIEAAWSLLLRDCLDGTRATEASRGADLLRRATWRRNNAYAVVLCVRAVDRLYGLAGMRGMQPDDPVQRAWRDVHAVAAQVSIAWDPQATNYGRARFGLPFTDPRA